MNKIALEIKELLYTNTNLTSNYTAKTVLSGEVSDYFDEIEIYYKFSTGVDVIKSAKVPYGKSGHLSCPAIGSNNNGGRLVTFNATSVTFDGGQYNGNSNNAYAIPWKIIGIHRETKFFT